MKKRLLSTALLVAAMASAYATSAASSDPGDKTAAAGLDAETQAAGFTALENACFGCHSPDATMENRIAPPMAAVKKRYLRNAKNFEQFSAQFVKFVSDPSADNAIMPGAIDRFGLMPQMSFDPLVVEQIAYYVYNNPLEAPDWFSQHYKNEQRRYRRSTPLALATPDDFLRRGKEIALSTKTELGSNLKNAMNAGGPLAAVAFCNENAIPIMKRKSAEFNATVRRVSDRPRNPDNTANENELAYIALAGAALAKGEAPKPQITERNDHWVGYYPIVTNGMCLQCHGILGKELAASTLNAIAARYPGDQAIGYGDNELRGIFVIDMPKAEQR
ncbi:MAG: DUF3365 domain-containing protein [Congregibacter sp.]|nr:DUF3365 domain-containing protein [Congregibacter sp.]